ncbi:MAG TPA: tetratricopeptide repeat protein [Methylophaga sp.]|nr:tetratricopeptide repeat protein [Methylophaga sp.]HEC58772.1 tetratricopeptide repeat protein [Methylophaga sp.]
MGRLYLPAFTLILIMFSLQSNANSANWQQLQSQAMQSYQDGDYLRAENAIEQAMIIADKADNGGAYKASSLNMLAYIYASQGKTEQALEAINKAVTLGKQVLGARDEQFNALLFNQGQLYQQANRPEQALASYQHAIDNYLALNSEGEGKLWQAVLLQAQILMDQQQFSQAETLINNALTGFINIAGFNKSPSSFDHDVELRILFAKLKLTQHQIQQAIVPLELALQSINNSVKQNKPNNDRELLVLELLANAYEDNAQQDKSISLRKQALQLRQQQGKPSLNSVMHLNELALQHQDKQEYQQAEKKYQEAFTLLLKLNKAESIEQALILGNFASLKLAQRDDDEALSLFEQSLTLHQKLNLRPIEAANIASYAASLYFKRHQYSQAEPLFLKALHWLDSSSSVNDDQRLVVLENLVVLYQSWSKSSKAGPYAQRARAIKDK